MSSIVVALRFLFTHPLDKSELAGRLVRTPHARKIASSRCGRVGAYRARDLLSLQGATLPTSAFLREASDQPEVAKAWNIDPSRMVIMGHSMGGLAAAVLVAAALSAVGIMSWWLIVPKIQAVEWTASPAVTHGRLSGISSPEIAAQIVDHGERWRLADGARYLAKEPLLVVTAKRDLPSSQAGLLIAALKADGARFDSVEIVSNHTFDDRRIELESVVLNWLARLGASANTSTHR